MNLLSWLPHESISIVKKNLVRIFLSKNQHIISLQGSKASQQICELALIPALKCQSLEVQTQINLARGADDRGHTGFDSVKLM